MPTVSQKETAVQSVAGPLSTSERPFLRGRLVNCVPLMLHAGIHRQEKKDTFCPPARTGRRTFHFRTVLWGLEKENPGCLDGIAGHDRVEETARSYRLITQPPIDIGEGRALVCGLPTAIKGKAERRI